FTDYAEFIVDVGDRPMNIGHSHNGMLIKRELLVRQFLECTFIACQSFVDDLLCTLSFGDVACNLGGTNDSSAAVLGGRDSGGDADPGTVLADANGFEMFNAFAASDSRQDPGLLLHAVRGKQNRNRFADSFSG